MRYSRYLKLLRPALAVALVAGLAACAGEMEFSGSSSDGASEPIEVTAAGDTANGCVVLNIRVEGGADLPEIDPDSIDDAIVVLDEDGDPVPDSVIINVSEDGSEAEARICAPCAYCSTYTGLVFEGVISDLEGNVLENLEIPEEFQELELEMDDNPGSVNGDCFGDFAVGDYDAWAPAPDGYVGLYYGDGDPSDGFELADFTPTPTENNWRMGHVVAITDAMGVTAGGGPNLLADARTGGVAFDNTGRVLLMDTQIGDPLELVYNMEIAGVDNEQRFGFRMGYLGDVNGDGYGDLAAAGRGAIVAGDPESSVEPRLFLGPWGGDMLSTDADAILRHDFGDPAGWDQISYQISGSDLDGDGLNDVLVSAGSVDMVPAPDQPRDAHWKLFIYSGADIAGSISAGVTDIMPSATVWGGGTDYLGFGYIFDVADVNGDGDLDLIVAAIQGELTSYAPLLIDALYGAAFIFFGPISMGSELTYDDADVMFSTAAEIMGFSVAAIGDRNGDGIDDLIVVSLLTPSVPGYPNSKAYLYYGRQDWEGVDGPADADGVITGVIDGATEQMQQVIYGAVGAGDVNNDGYKDYLISAIDRDTDQASQYLFLGSQNVAAPTIDLSLAEAVFSSPDGASATGLTAAASIDGSLCDNPYPLEDYVPAPEEPPKPKDGGGDERLPEY